MPSKTPNVKAKTCVCLFRKTANSVFRSKRLFAALTEIRTFPTMHRASAKLMILRLESAAQKFTKDTTLSLLKGKSKTVTSSSAESPHLALSVLPMKARELHCSRASLQQQKALEVISSTLQGGNVAETRQRKWPRITRHLNERSHPVGTSRTLEVARHILQHPFLRLHVDGSRRRWKSVCQESHEDTQLCLRPPEAIVLNTVETTHHHESPK